MDLSSISIMIVEDQRSIRSLLVSTLRALGIGKVIGVHSAEEAMERIRTIGDEAKYTNSNPLSAILLDIVLDESKFTGLDIAEWIRTSPDSPNKFLPIMMFSALASMSMVQRSRNLGVNIFMRKPFAVDNLTSLLMGLIRDQRSFIKCNDYFGPDRRRASHLAIPHDPERRADNVSNASKGLKVFKRSKSVGGYTLKEENIVKAEEVFVETTEKAVADLDQRIVKMQEMHELLKESARTLQKITGESPEVLEQKSHQIATMANAVLDNMVLVRLNLGVFRVPILSQITLELSEFVCQLTANPAELINNDAIVIIEKFIHFMQAIMKSIDAIDDAQGGLLIKDLQGVCNRFSKKYISHPMDDSLVDEKIRDSIARIKSQNLVDDMEADAA